jgi:hypothetical protein
MAAKKKTGSKKKPRDPVGFFNFGANRKPRKKSGIRYDK